jgi:hypothetical protein
MTNTTKQNTNQKAIDYIVGNSGKSTKGLIKIHFKGSVGVLD